MKAHGEPAGKATAPGPWRLENALLVDKSPAGDDLYEGHGAPEVSPGRVAPGTRDQVLHDLVRVYNLSARRALALAREVDRDPARIAEMNRDFPRVTKDPAAGWIIHERDDRPENRDRKRRRYPLELTGVGDPDLIGLRDPTDPTRMNTVKRPGESAQGPWPKP